MLASVKRPDAVEVTFKYDALGRRIEKRFGRRITAWVWDGNVPLHEKAETRTPDYSTEKGYFDDVRTEPVVTWIFEAGTFVPAAKLTEKEQYSIVTNYLGTPEAMYRDDGEAVWTCELNSYGKVRDYKGESKTMCPFRYQGQYEDAETGLYYNRFRYYDCETGSYISQDPIGLNGDSALYGYVRDVNSWVDIFGLAGTGGAYMFGFESGEMYIGKGEIERMQESISTRQKTVANPQIKGQAHVSTGGNNELGKMVEYKTMRNAGFDRGKIPENYLNSFLSGESAWNAPKNKHLQGQANYLADKLRADYEADVKARQKIKGDCG
jgi:RHS repeat-associated protein